MKRFLPIISLIALGAGILGFLTLSRAQVGGIPLVMIDEQIRTHATQLAQESCYWDLANGANPPSEETQVAINACANTQLNSILGNKDEQRQALIDLMLRTAAKRPAQSIPIGFEVEDTPNFFFQLTYPDAKLLYHDLANCYFNEATRTTIDFYLKKAKGEQESNHKTDTKLTKDDIYDVKVPDETYCRDLYDDAALFKGNEKYEKRITMFTDALSASVADAGDQEADRGFTSVIGEFVLQDLTLYMNFLNYIQDKAPYRHFADNVFPEYIYAPEGPSRDTFLASLTTRQTDLFYEGTHAQDTLKASLRAFSNFERTLPLHIQYEKIHYLSDEIRKKIRRLRLGWKGLNIKFTNAAIEGGAK